MWNFRQIKMDEISKREDSLFEHVSKLIDEARKHVKTTIDTTMVYTYYGVGKYIVVDEQQGYARAKYGKTVLRNLSKKLTERYVRAGLLKLLLQPENSIRYTAKEKSQTLFTKFKRMQIFISLFPGLIISYSCVLLIKMNVIFMRLNATSRIGVSDNYSGSTTPASMSDWH